MPTIVIGEELFWGDDRLEDAAAAHRSLRGALSGSAVRLDRARRGERSISSWRGEGRNGSLVSRGRPRLAQWPITSRLRAL